MTERLDQIERLLGHTAERLDQTAAQQQQNTIDIDNLVGVIAVTETTVPQLTARAEENDRRSEVRSEEIDRRFEALRAQWEESNRRFDTLRAEGIADRRKTQQLFNDAVNQMNIDRARADTYH